MNKILFYLSKTDFGIIKKCPYSTRLIQASLGLFVLLTGIFAFISGSFAISNMFIHEDILTGIPTLDNDTWYVSLGLGSIFSIFIMAIDREIVSASNRLAIFARIPLAIIISLVVSLPIELKLFEGKIIKTLSKEIKTTNDSLKQNLNREIFTIEARIDTLNHLKQIAVVKRDEWASAMEAEVVGTIKIGRTGKAGLGPAFRIDSVNKLQQENMIAIYENELIRKKKELDIAQQVRDSAFKLRKEYQSYDLLSKYISLREIRRKDFSGSASILSWGITILFLLFELTPSIMKLLLPKTEYDVLLDKRRLLNLLAIRSIYEEALSQYEGKTAREIMVENPARVDLMLNSQSI